MSPGTPRDATGPDPAGRRAAAGPSGGPPAAARPGGRPPETPRSRGSPHPAVPPGTPQAPRATTQSPPRSAVDNAGPAASPARGPPRGPGPPGPVRPAASPAAANRGRRLGIVLLAIAFVLSLFAGRLVQLQGMESGNYRKLALQERDQHQGAARDARQHHRRQRADAGHDRGHLHGDRRPAADPGEPAPARRRLAGRPARPDLGRGPGQAPAPDLARLRPAGDQRAGPASGQITALDLPGIYQAASYARSYPEGSVAANLVGFTGTRKTAPSPAGAGSKPSTTRCWPASRAASRCRSATASRSRWPAARTPRPSTAAACASPSSRRCSTRPSRPAPPRSRRPRRTTARW